MSLIQRLSPLIAPFRPAFWRRERSDSCPAAAPLDPAEEFQKLQRGLRRLSLSSDRSSEILQAVSSRIDELQQSILKLSRPHEVALGLEEREVLGILDQLDRAAAIPDLPEAARPPIEAAKATLLASARWQVIALMGANPEGTDIRIAEYLGASNEDGHADVRIHRILEQGYRRADGSLLRPSVVIAAAATFHSNSHTLRDRS